MDDERRQPLLPEWSTLVILLVVFGMVSTIALITILRGGHDEIDPEHGGTRAYGPADFPEIDWREPLLPAVLESRRAGGAKMFDVPPPPLSDGIYPCSGCHADLEADPEPRELGFHDEIALDHGPDERWCLDCHDPDDRDRLRLATGGSIEFDESYRLCGQCHGTIYRDWRQGIHGRRRGFWNGAKSYMLCAHCHDPHVPRFAPMVPLPPPVRPQYLRDPEEEP